MARPITRVSPAGSARDYQTYAVRSPIETHTRPATCAEVDCEHWRDGWVSWVDESTTNGAIQAQAVRTACRRADRPAQPGDPRRVYTERSEGPWTAFDFPPGQACFLADDHRVSLERPELYIVRGGDWRANTGLIRRHHNGDEWVEDFAEHQDRLHTLHERG